VLRW